MDRGGSQAHLWRNGKLEAEELFCDDRVPGQQLRTRLINTLVTHLHTDIRSGKINQSYSDNKGRAPVSYVYTWVLLAGARWRKRLVMPQGFPAPSTKKDVRSRRTCSIWEAANPWKKNIFMLSRL